MTAPDPCPLCDQPLYGWIALPATDTVASIGMPLEGRPAGELVIDRCENCGVAIEHGREIDLATEWSAVRRSARASAGLRNSERASVDTEIAIPNRASLQAAIGVEGWAAIRLSPGRLLLTPHSLELLAERNGEALGRLRFPFWGAQQGWMWQTLLNGLTFHPNFAREVRAGRLRPANARSGLAFAVDSVVTVLGAPLIALVSVPLELVAALIRRGGEIRAPTGA